MLVLLHIASQKSFKLCVLCSWILVTSGVIFGHVRSMRPGLTAGALGPSIVSLNTNKSSSSSSSSRRRVEDMCYEREVTKRGVCLLLVVFFQNLNFFGLGAFGPVSPQ